MNAPENTEPAAPPTDDPWEAFRRRLTALFEQERESEQHD